MIMTYGARAKYFRMQQQTTSGRNVQFLSYSYRNRQMNERVRTLNSSGNHQKSKMSNLIFLRLSFVRSSYCTSRGAFFAFILLARQEEKLLFYHFVVVLVDKVSSAPAFESSLAF